MPAAACKPVSDVAEILHKVQESAGCHKKYARMFWATEAVNSNKCYQDLFGAIMYLVTVPLRASVYVERTFRFLAVVVKEAPEMPDGSSTTFIQDLIADILKLATAQEKIVRIRACSLLSNFMLRLQIEVDDETLDDVQQTMLDRLKDKVPLVRMHAAATLERLAEPGEDGSFKNDPVVAAYRRLMNCERNKDIRKCLLAIMPVAKGATIQEILRRTQDTNDSVRRQAYMVISTKSHVRDLTSKERARLINSGLGDRSPAVVSAAQSLLQAWLTEGCESNILDLLELIDVHAYPGEAQKALDALNMAGSLDLKDIAVSARRQGQGLHSSPEHLLSATEAFFWRWMTDWLHKTIKEQQERVTTETGAAGRVRSAAIDDLLQVQEDLLPDSSMALMTLVASHVEAGAQHTHSAIHLLELITTSADLSDAAVRQAAFAMLATTQRPSIRECDACAWCTAVCKLAERLYSCKTELQQWLKEASHTAAQEADSSKEPEQRHIHQLVALEFASALYRSISVSHHIAADDVGLLDSLIYPGLAASKSAIVREEATQCLGLYACCLLSCFKPGDTPRKEQMLAVHLLRAALVHDKCAQVQCAAGKALCDLVLLYGCKPLDACHTLLTQHPEEFLGDIPPQQTDKQAAAAKAADASEQRLTRFFLSTLPSLTEPAKSPEMQELGATVQQGSYLAEGLAKVLMHHNPANAAGLEGPEMLEIFAALLILWVDPRTESANHIRQTLSVFFPAVAACSSRGKQALFNAGLLAARNCKHLPPAPAKKALQRLPAFVLQHVEGPSTEGAVEEDLVSQAAEDALIEILASSSRPPISASHAALLHLLTGLPLEPVGLVKLNRIAYLADRLQRTVSGASAKDLSTLRKRLKATAPVSVEALSEEEIQGLCRRVQTLQASRSESADTSSPISSRTRRRNSTTSGAAVSSVPRQQHADGDDSTASSSISSPDRQ